MPKFRKKPVVIEAIKWTGRNVRELTMWASQVDLDHKKASGLAGLPCRSGGERERITLLPIDVIARGDGSFDLMITTPEGEIRADHGDFVICGVKGEFYPCKPDIFEATYDPVDIPTTASVVTRSPHS